MLEKSLIYVPLRHFSNGSVVSLGIYPFLVASIIMQFLTLIIPKLRNIAMQGEAGSGFITKLTRYCSVVMDIIFAVLYCLGTHSLIDSRISFWLGAGIVTLTVACGSAFCSWCVELLNTKGLGNGITIILTAGIIRSIPPALVSGSIINAVAAVVIGAAFIILAVLRISARRNSASFFEKNRRHETVRNAESGNSASRHTGRNHADCILIYVDSSAGSSHSYGCAE